MKKFCTFIPSKGEILFKELKSKFGYDVAKNTFLVAIHPRFIEDYKKSLSLDAEGLPSIESVLSNPYIQKFIGDEKIIQSESKKYDTKEDTVTNYNILLGEAYQFNTTSPYKDQIIAVVDRDESGIQVNLTSKDERSITKFNSQFSANELNKQLVSMFSDAGLNIDDVTDIESDINSVENSEFDSAKELAENLYNLVLLANDTPKDYSFNDQVTLLLSDLNIDNPLVSRVMSAINNEETLSNILGDNYNSLKELYKDDLNAIAVDAYAKLLLNHLNDQDIPKIPISKSLLDRSFKSITSKFKDYDSQKIIEIITNSDNSKSDLAKELIKSATENVVDPQAEVRNEKLEQLQKRIDRNLEILKTAANTEKKRLKISKSEDTSKLIQMRLEQLFSYSFDDVDTVEGLMNYSQHALSDLTAIFKEFDNYRINSESDIFSILRKAKSYLDSYAGFIESMNSLINDESIYEDSMGDIEFEIDEKDVTLKQVVYQLNSLNASLLAKYKSQMLPALESFYKGVFTDELATKFAELTGSELTLTSILTTTNKDISFTDRWLDSMGNSSNLLLQMIDKKVKQADDQVRMQTINSVKEIQALMMKAESFGIKDFEWMFETDSDGNKTGNYISDVNVGQFQKDLKELDDRLKEEYGVNPSGQKAKDKIAAKKNWLNVNSSKIKGVMSPNPVIYRNTKFDSLSDNEMTILREYIRIKNKQDSLYPSSYFTGTKAIQIRKNSTQRLLNSMTSPKNFYDNIKNSTEEAWLDQADDDQLFGERTDKGLQGFDGKEYYTLPVLFNNSLNNPNELSTDVFAALMQHVYASNRYNALSDIVDPLELTRDHISSKDYQILKTKGGNTVVEQFKVLGETVKNKISDSDANNIEAKLNSFLESRIYGRYLKDAGSFEVLGKSISTTKTVSNLLKISSTANLAFNFLSNIANIGSGIAMQNIEAFAGQFFSTKTLLKADGIYMKEVLNTMKELPDRVKTNKLDLFNELFEIDQNYRNDLKSNQKASLLERIFGVDIAFIGQRGGDHWMYNRSAIAMALNHNVIVDGKLTTVWDALVIEDVYKNNDKIKKMTIPTAYNEDGTPFSISEFSRQIAKVNHGTFGIYNSDDSNAASRTIGGRIIMQHRNWMKPQFNKRFQAAQHDLTTGSIDEGYYRTLYRLANSLRKGQVKLPMIWNTLKPYEKANVRRSILELAQLFAVWLLVNNIEWGDDEKRPWAMKLAEYSSRRLLHELGGLAPSTMFVRENLKNLQSPAAILTSVNDTFNLVTSVLDPTSYIEEYQSGPYEGMTHVEKAIAKSDLPIIAQYAQINKFTSGLEYSIEYQKRQK